MMTIRKQPFAALIAALLLGGNAGLVLAQSQAVADVRPLPEVRVRAEAEHAIGGFAGTGIASGARLGIFGNRSTFDVPIATKSFTEEAVLNAGARTAADLLRSDASFSGTLNSTVSGSDAGLIRGFRSFLYEASFDGSMTVMNRRMPLEFIERVDILKGPATFHSGVRFFGGVGGTVNYESKKPTADPLSILNLTASQRGLYGAHVDLSRRFGDGGAWGIRVNAAVRDGETPHRNVDEESRILHVALNYTGEKLRADAQFASVYGRVDGASFGYTLAPGVAIPRPAKNRDFRGPSWAYSEYDYHFSRLQLELDLSEHWRLKASLQGSNYEENFLNSPATILNAAGNVSGSVSRQFGSADWGDFWSADLALTGVLRTNRVKHRLTVALSKTKYLESFDDRRFSTPAQAWNIYNPASLVNLPTPVQIAPATGRYPLFDNVGKGLALVDEISMWDDRLIVTAGLRWNSIAQDFFAFAAPTPGGAPTRQYEKSRWSPALGLVYKPIPGLSLYANRLEAIERGGNAPATAVNPNEALPPGISIQTELGAKWVRGDIAYTLTYFDISRPFAFTDPVTRVFALLGQQVNRGFEFDVFGRLNTQTRLYASFAYLDPRITRSAGGTLDGKLAPGVPRQRMVIGLERDLQSFPDLTMSAQLQHTGSSAFNAANTLHLPSFSTVDLGARWRLDLVGRKAVARFAVDNVLDKDFFIPGDGRLNQGSPRTLRASIQIPL